jgi:predicted nucleic acid-binding protein
MLAVDTNVIVRYLTGDHPEQAAKAKALIDGSEVFVSTTVLLETSWVLGRILGTSRSELVESLRAFVGLPSVRVENPAETSKALDWAAQGMDFADALHLSHAEDCAALVTFDQRFVAIGRRLGSVDVRLLDGEP